MKKIILFTILLAFMVPATGWAQTGPTYTALEPLPCIPGNGITCPGGAGSYQTTFSFQNYVQYIFNLAIAIAAAAAVFMMIWGGFQYMTTDSWENKKDGLGKVKKSLYGLLLILTSYLILRTVDPRLVAIPATLVKPLSIQNTRAPGTYFNQLDTIQNQLESALTVVQNPQAKEQLGKLKADAAGLQDILGQIDAKVAAAAAKTGNPLYTNLTPAKICEGRADPRDTEVMELCRDRITVTNQQWKDNQDMITISSTAIMGDRLAKCFSSPNFSVSDCKAQLNADRVLAQQRLVAISASPDVVNNYAAYSNTMMDIFSVMKEYSKTQKAQNSPSSAVLSAPLVGALIPGGTLIGTAVAQGVANAYYTFLFGKDSELALTRISRIVEATSVTDPKLKQALNDQVESLKKRKELGK